MDLLLVPSLVSTYDYKRKENRFKNNISTQKDFNFISKIFLTIEFPSKKKKESIIIWAEGNKLFFIVWAERILLAKSIESQRMWGLLSKAKSGVCCRIMIIIESYHGHTHDYFYFIIVLLLRIFKWVHKFICKIKKITFSFNKIKKYLSNREPISVNLAVAPFLVPAGACL